MIETGSGLLLPRRYATKLALVTGAAALLPWTAYAAESDELEAKANEYAAQADAKQDEADALMEKIDALQDQLNEANQEYDDAVAAHDAAVDAMNEAQGRIDEATELISQYQGQLSSRVSSMYKDGDVASNFISVLLGSSSFEEFTTNLDALSRIADQDAQLVQNNKDAKAEAEQAHAEYSEQEQIAAEEMAKAQKAADEIAETQAAMQEELDQVNEDILALKYQEQQALDDAEAAKEKEEAAKKAALEAAAKAANATVSTASDSDVASISVDGWANPCSAYGITSPFGPRPSLGDYHYGVDIGCPTGYVCTCMAAGTVTHAGWFGTGGNAILVSHGNGVVTWYLHASELLVSVGDQVEAGTPVIKCGSTGYVTGPHLHFQININDTAVNPELYFSW